MGIDDGMTLTRRRFLRQGAMAAGAVVLPYIAPSSVLGQGSSVEPSNRVVMGFIGLGIQGTALMRAFLTHEDVQVAAVCDVYESQRVKAKGIVDEYYDGTVCATYNDFREVCTREDIDAVCVATPDHWHVPVSLEAARCGKDLYTEKALGLSLAWDKALQETCHRHGTVFQWGITVLFNIDLGVVAAS